MRRPHCGAQSLACVLHEAGSPLRLGFGQFISGTPGDTQKMGEGGRVPAGVSGCPAHSASGLRSLWKVPALPGQGPPRAGTPQERHYQGLGVERDRRPCTLTGSLAGVRGNGNRSALVERPPPPTTCFRKRVVNEPTP